MSNKNWINYDSSIKTGQRCDKPHIKIVSTLHTLFLIPEKLSRILVPGETWAAFSSLHCLCDICAKERRIVCMTVQMEVSKLIKIKLIQLKVKIWSPSADKQVSVTNMKHVLKIFMRTEGSDWIWTHLSPREICRLNRESWTHEIIIFKYHTLCHFIQHFVFYMNPPLDKVAVYKIQPGDHIKECPHLLHILYCRFPSYDRITLPMMQDVVISSIINPTIVSCK